MCGIVGYIGGEEAAPILLDGLSRLEYRGYDSAGLALWSPPGGMKVVSRPRAAFRFSATWWAGGKALSGAVGLGHTRWATHGAPSDVNSHPQVSEKREVCRGAQRYH